MEKPLSFVMKLSLKEIALRSVVINMWNDLDVWVSIEKYQKTLLTTDNFIKLWQKTVEVVVRKKVSKFMLPELLKEQLLHKVTCIGLQIGRWRCFHEIYLSDNRKECVVPISVKLHWTSTGMIDYCKTAEELIRCEMVDKIRRYKLASLYCLDDCIKMTWDELTEEARSYFYDKDEGVSQIDRPHLQFCWPYILNGDESKLEHSFRRYLRERFGFHKYAFEYAATTGNITAAEYFLQKLTHEERKDSLVRTAYFVVVGRHEEVYSFLDHFPKENLSGVLCYLLSLMNKEEQMVIFRKKPSWVLRCFLDWPWQDFFLEISDLIWDCLLPSDYAEVIENMISSFKNSEYEFSILFQEFFKKSPMDFRKYFVDRECRSGYFLSTFLSIQDCESIRVVFRNVDVGDRVRLVFSEHVFKIFYNFILKGRWYFVEECLREAMLSKKDRERLKEDFMIFLKRTGEGKIKWRKRKWKRFFLFLDDVNAGKRTLEDETLTDCKKLCRVE